VDGATADLAKQLGDQPGETLGVRRKGFRTARSLRAEVGDLSRDFPVDGGADRLRTHPDCADLVLPRPTLAPVFEPGVAAELTQPFLLAPPGFPRRVDDVARARVRPVAEVLVRPVATEREQFILFNLPAHRLEFEEGLAELLESSR